MFSGLEDVVVHRKSGHASLLFNEHLPGTELAPLEEVLFAISLTKYYSNFEN